MYKRVFDIHAWKLSTHAFNEGDMIKLSLEGKAVPNPTGGAKWDISQIRSILGNEKYCGDVLMQKTFTQDCINKKVIKNTGQLPMYLIQNNHPAIVSREIYQAVQAEKKGFRFNRQTIPMSLRQHIRVEPD